MKRERIVKLPIGKANVVIKQCKTGYADGAQRPRRAPKQVKAFNPALQNRIILRKAA